MTTGMTAVQMLELLQRWRTAGWLRALDLALVRFMLEHDPAAPPSLLLATALLAQLEGSGHSCLPLDEISHDAAALLAWPVAAAPELAQALLALPADAATASAAWAGSPVLQADPADGAGATPLVLAGTRLYLRRYWRHERQIAAQVLARVALPAGQAPGLDTDRARRLFPLLFPEPQPGTDWQQVACALALRGRLTLITGGPGTGKTYTAARLLVLLQALHGSPQPPGAEGQGLRASPRPLRVALAAPTGKAAARLRQSIVGALQQLQPAMQSAGLRLDAAPPSMTLHALLGTRAGARRFVHDAANPLDVDLLFVDEASMVHLEMMDALLAALPPQARLVLLGDKDQLASVEAGAVLGDLCRPADAVRADTSAFVHSVCGQTLAVADAPTSDLAQQTVQLQHSHRFAGGIGQLARAVNKGHGAAALALLQDAGHGDIALHAAADAHAIAAVALQGRAVAHDASAPGYRPYLDLLAQGPQHTDAAAFDTWARDVLRAFDRCRVLCALREGPWGVAGVNTAIETLLAQRRLLQRRGGWYVGRPVMVTRNDAALGVFNGDIGLVLQPPGAAASALRVYFLDGEALRSVSVHRLADVETAFALTVHKSQGSEFEHVLLVLPPDDHPVLTRELLYTGITRARRALTVVGASGNPVAAAVRRLTRRVSGLHALLGEQTAPAPNHASPLPTTAQRALFD